MLLSRLASDLSDVAPVRAEDTTVLEWDVERVNSSCAPLLLRTEKLLASLLPQEGAAADGPGMMRPEESNLSL